MSLLTMALVACTVVGVVALGAQLRKDPATARPRRSRRPPPPPDDHGDVPLRMVQERIEAHEQHLVETDRQRVEMDEAARRCRAWAAQVARARAAEWHGYKATTGLIEVELGREAIAVARERLRQGASVDDAVRHAISVVEELAVDVVQRVGLIVDEWKPAPTTEDEKQADRRRRIERLRAKARSTTFPAEAASFHAKADQLAARYGIAA